MNILFDINFSKCYFNELTGFPCITCGFTRAFNELLKGNIFNSINYNAGFLPFLFTIIFIFISYFYKNNFVKNIIPKMVYFTLITLFLQWTFKIYLLFN